MLDSALPRFKRDWEGKGLGWFVEVASKSKDVDNATVVRAYYGSSTYNTDEMSRLIDYIVQDAQSLGIDVKPEEEIKSLLTDWHPDE